MPDIQLTVLEKKMHNLLSEAVSQFFPEFLDQFMDACIVNKECNSFYSFLYLEKKSQMRQLQGQRIIVEIRLFRKLEVPIQCLLHIKEGFFHLIETFCADSSALPNDVDMERYEVIVNSTSG